MDTGYILHFHYNFLRRSIGWFAAVMLGKAQILFKGFITCDWDKHMVHVDKINRSVVQKSCETTIENMLIKNHFPARKLKTYIVMNLEIQILSKTSL